jgi:hypothetical protein
MSACSVENAHTANMTLISIRSELLDLRHDRDFYFQNYAFRETINSAIKSVDRLIDEDQRQRREYANGLFEISKAQHALDSSKRLLEDQRNSLEFCVRESLAPEIERRIREGVAKRMNAENKNREKEKKKAVCVAVEAAEKAMRLALREEFEADLEQRVEERVKEETANREKEMLEEFARKKDDIVTLEVARQSLLLQGKKLAVPNNPAGQHEQRLQPDDKTTSRCSMCMEREICLVFGPCQHATSCRRCARLILHTNTLEPRCPICNSIILDIEKVFISH